MLVKQENKAAKNEVHITEIEEIIGRTIQLALEKEFGKKPQVDLEKPYVNIHAEVLGKRTMIGIIRRKWFD